MSRLTSSEARAFQARWRLINEAEREELRTTPIEVKFQQLLGLMASARELGWAEPLPEQEAAVRKRWLRLKRAYGV